MRLAFAASFALVLAACGGSSTSDEPTASHNNAEPGQEGHSEEAQSEQGDGGIELVDLSLQAFIDTPWRSDAAKARDAWRNPVETLEFFGIDPTDTVMEIWPGGGWYADILAPWLTANGGTYVAGWPRVDPTSERAVDFRNRFIARFDTPQFGPATLAVADPAGFEIPEGLEIDAIVTFRNTHSFMGREAAETMYGHFFSALQPGGVLGVVQHRLPADRVQGPRASTGYVQQDFVRALAEEAGFVFEAASEVNANPADTADHPFGVWTLPPVARNAAFGEPANPEFDRAPYDAIGESDRMTLRFRKPIETESGDASQ